MQIRSGQAYSGIDLSEVDFTDLDLTDCAFNDCLFSGLILSNTVLEGARFKGSAFTGCRFAHADLREAVFEDCTLSVQQAGCQFAFSRMDMARFTRCDLSFGKFDRIEAYGLEFDTCNLRGAVFLKADFGRAFGRTLVRTSGRFKACNLELADLTDLALPEGEFAGSSLREADLTGANLEGADLRSVDLFQALTMGTRLARADLRGAEISGLNLAALGSYADMKVNADQQHRLLTAMGIDVLPD